MTDDSPVCVWNFKPGDSVRHRASGDVGIVVELLDADAVGGSRLWRVSVGFDRHVDCLDVEIEPDHLSRAREDVVDELIQTVRDDSAAGFFPISDTLRVKLTHFTNLDNEIKQKKEQGH